MTLVDNGVSPVAEMLAYEVLLSRPNTSVKSLVDELRSKRLLPSEYLKADGDMFKDELLANVQRYLSTKTGFSVSIAGDFQFPTRLQEAGCPAELFYYRGDLGVLESRCVSVVGTRQATADGLARARKLSSGLTKHGFTIISGLAEGIDTAALSEAIKCGGRVVGVIGTPIDANYPKGNAELQETVARHHLLISQVPFYRYKVEAFKMKRLYFPMRNETMSALSEATLIVEAGDTSGTLTQARACLKQGRKLLILNSCFSNRAITWPARFLEKGAIRVSSIEEILAVLGPSAG
jgi:DNA processing protein